MNLYQEHILDHYHHPRNFGQIDHPDYHAEEYNALCGDRIEIYIKGKNKIQSIKFSGEGCAISQAAASLLTEHLKKLKQVKTAKSLKEKDAIGLLRIKLTPARRKCALISYQALKKALNS